MTGTPARRASLRRFGLPAAALLLGTAILLAVNARPGPADLPDGQPPATWHNVGEGISLAAAMEQGIAVVQSDDPTTLLVRCWAGELISSVSLPGEAIVMTAAGQRYAIMMAGDERIHLYSWPDRLELSIAADGSDIDALAVGDGGTLFLAGRDAAGGFVTAVRKDGTTAWRHRMETARIISLGTTNGPDLLIAGVVNTGPVRYFVTRLGPGGEHQWTEPVAAPVYSLVASGGVVAALTPGEVNVLGRGGKLWSAPTPGALLWGAVLLDDGAVAVLFDDGQTTTVTRYRHGGGVDWSVELAGRAGAIAASTEGDLIVATSAVAVCLDRRGQLRWSAESFADEDRLVISAAMTAQGGYIQFDTGPVLSLTVTTRGGR